MSTNKFRTWILTGAFAAVTATGAWYGAGLKTQEEFKQEVQTVQQASVEDRIAVLEQTKQRLLGQKAELQKKIDQLAAKTAEESPAARNVQSR